MRKQIAAANWKMNLTYDKAMELMNALISHSPSVAAHQQIILGVPFPYLLPVIEKSKQLPQTSVAAQNCHTKAAGAYTGETSAAMLQSIGVEYVILGHSERREYFHETNAMLAEKVNIALAHELKPIFCCGEPISIREADTQNDYVEAQLRESLFHLDENALQSMVIAYEPIWAIGTGKTATAAQAQQMHEHIRDVIARSYGAVVADAISILYGGSVKGANARELFSQPDVDGGLVGGASLQAEEFIQIIHGLK